MWRLAAVYVLLWCVVLWWVLLGCVLLWCDVVLCYAVLYGRRNLTKNPSLKLSGTSPQRRRRHVRQANGRTGPKNAGSTEDRLQPTRAAHLAAHLLSPHQDHHLQIQQLHTSIPTHQASSTTTSARTGEAPRSRACAKMLVRAGYRCPCHFLRECPSVLFLQPVTLLFHTTTDAD